MELGDRQQPSGALNLVEEIAKLPHVGVQREFYRDLRKSLRLLWRVNALTDDSHPALPCSLVQHRLEIGRSQRQLLPG